MFFMCARKYKLNEFSRRISGGAAFIAWSFKRQAKPGMPGVCVKPKQSLGTKGCYPDVRRRLI